MLRHIFLSFLIAICAYTDICANDKHWTVADGLPTGEVQQIVELPNGQMLVNCEGVFCLSDGNGFIPVPCKRNNTYRLKRYCDNGYGYLWQGDSLLWLRDFYRIYLFDARTRSFRYDIASRLADKRTGSKHIAEFAGGKLLSSMSVDKILAKSDIQELHFQTTCAAIDRQGGVWMGTLTDGIFYHSPLNKHVDIIANNSHLLDIISQVVDYKGRKWNWGNYGAVCDNNGAKTIYDATNVDGLKSSEINFMTELPDHRFLVGHSLGTLGYFYPEGRRFVSLLDKVPELKQYRYFVGACVVNSRWTAVYTQNGAFLIDIKTNKLASFPRRDVIENYSDKYNCMLRDAKGKIYVGTQNGLFCLEPSHDGSEYSCRKISFLANNCIRSIVADKSGNIWVGTSWGISRVTPSVVNLNIEDGSPNVLMHERMAKRLADGRLAFACCNGFVVFNPDSVVGKAGKYVPILTSVKVNGEPLDFAAIASDNIHLAHTQNYITFGISALNYVLPSHMHYRYRLEGLESDWHTQTDCENGLCTVHYSALPPGKYIFQAQAALDSGEWGSVMQKQIVINPPLWLTWWAKLIYAIIATTIIVYVGKMYQKRRREKMEKENDARVNQLFELRDKARHQFAESTEIDPRRISTTDEEEKLMERMLKAIDVHMGDVDFGVDQLAMDVGMSRSALYAKLRTMLGITPSDFIRNVRLKHAAQLLAKTQIPINEISLRIGYNTPKAFTTNFKRAFGMLPSEYRNPGIKDDAL